MCGTNTMGPLLGLAYDTCADVLYATDGRFTVRLAFNPITCTVLGAVGCCTNTLEPYIGLDVLTNNETSSGPNCTAGTCPACVSMAHALGGDPYVGSPTFALNLNNCPGATTAVAIFNVGACGAPIFSPPLCAGIRVPFVPPWFSSPMPSGGTAGLCNGSASMGLPIPPNSALCGVACCSQFVGFCPPLSLANTYVSNALSWTIGGS
jgi:hypothetical protein